MHIQPMCLPATEPSCFRFNPVGAQQARPHSQCQVKTRGAWFAKWRSWSRRGPRPWEGVERRSVACDVSLHVVDAYTSPQGLVFKKCKSKTATHGLTVLGMPVEHVPHTKFFRHDSSMLIQTFLPHYRQRLETL